MDRARLLFGGACLLLSVGCGGASNAAAQNRTFYDSSVATGASPGFEQRYPPLDFGDGQTSRAYLGVSVVRGRVRFSRPREWVIREGSNEPGKAFVQYISPNAYAFAVYERADPPSEKWTDVLGRYEDDVASVGAKILGKRVPIGTWRGQGRAYTIERSVEAAKRPFISRSREMVVRGEHAIVLVQIVHQNDDLSSIDQDLLRVIGTLEVL